MKKDVIAQIEECWGRTLSILTDRLKESSRQIEDLLTLEDHYRTGHKSENLKRSMRGFGDGVFDADSLSQVLGQGDERRLMSKDRYHRVRKTRDELKALVALYEKSPPRPATIELDASEEQILKRAEEHLNRMAEPLRLVRLVHLEIRARYQGELHDAFFNRFNWEHLEDDEIALCPPFIVLGDSPEMSAQLPKLLGLVSSGKPVKVLLMRSSLPKRSGPLGRSSALQSALDIEMLPLAMRGIFVMQSTLAHPELGARLERGLRSPRPAVISLFGPNADRRNGFHARAERALSSRAYPNLVYDPDSAPEFVSCFDLAGNPAMDRNWPEARIEYRSENGEAQTLDREFTFADFAVQESAFTGEFSPLLADQDDRQPIPLAKYLSLPTEQRAGKLPFVYALNENQRLTKLVPSRAMILQTAERLKLWRALREVAGYENPHVKAAEKKVKDRLLDEKEASLKEVTERMRADIAARQKDAVSAAMRNLARRLTGMKTIEAAPLAQAAPAPEAPAQATPAAKAKPAGVSDLPWIESKRCTTCDECLNINKNIFAYNDNKQAIIKDPKGGPFRDIVKAAEKCSAHIIHPGKPQDPSEKNLDAWMKKAEVFQ